MSAFVVTTCVAALSTISTAAQAAAVTTRTVPGVNGHGVVGHCGNGGQCGGPAGQPPNELDGVSCVGPTDCVAVGSYYVDDAHPRQTLIESWDGNNWTIVPSPNPGTADLLRGVSCTTATSCVAVGSSGNVWPPDRVLVESWDGSTWTVASAPTPVGSTAGLDGVSCTGPSACTAVGSSDTGGGPPERTLVESWDGTTWTVVPSPSPGASYSILQGISCTDPLHCVAVGGYLDGGSLPTRTLVESWNGSAWTVVPGPSPPLATNSLAGVSCTTPTDCMAVGLQSDGVVVTRTLAEAWDGTNWRVVPSPDPDTVGMLAGVSCTGAYRCVAVGRGYSSDHVDHTLVTTWDGTAWSADQSPSPAGSVTIFVNGVSCSSATWCVAVGRSATGSGDDVTLVEHWNGTGWSIVTSPNVRHLLAPVAGMAATPDGQGYWVADAAGDVTAHGAAVNFGSMGGQALNAPVTHIVATADGNGYWLVAADGGTFAFGDARFYGSMGSALLNAPVVDMTPTPSGHGYWLVASDGGVFSFGDARFAGSMGGRHLNRPVVGMAPDARTGGYWEVATDGGIFAFAAPFLGSTGGSTLTRPVVGMAATSGAGYWTVAGDGGVFAFGDAAFRGSMGGQPLNAPVVGMAADHATGGYWLVGADGGIFSFGAPFYGPG